MSTITKLAKGSLKSQIIKLIQLRGPMSVADYMKVVLLNPESGFYMNNDVFGVKGHFTTSPEISQIFGEVLGVWILNEWKRFNCPKPLRLVEFGPGRGTLMSDITRTLNNFKQTYNNVKLQLIEMSPHLREVQRQTLCHNSSIIDNTEWHSSIDHLDKNPDGFTAYIAHEFLDALPIHKFVRDPQSKGWRELVIDYDHKQDLRFCIAKKPSLSGRLLIPPNFKGDHIEICPEAALHLEKISDRLNASGKGCMLICDYGFEDEPDEGTTERVTCLKPMKSNRDTFRAFKDHNSWPPLKDAGEADLTADVDFGYMKKHIADKAVVFGTVNQADFLIDCGFQARLNVLLEKANDKERDDLTTGANMLINEMGQRYRFLSLFPKSASTLFEGNPPAGFNTEG